MGSKADAREARKQEGLAKFEAAKQKLLNRTPLDTGPRVAQLPDSERYQVKTGVDPYSLSIPMQPKAAKSGASIIEATVTWCTRRGDVEGTWTWGEHRAWSDSEWVDEILPKFAELEKLVWREVLESSSESGHRMHHSHELHEVAKEAQIRWLELGLEQFDTLFRFRLGATKRFWGFRIGPHFFGVWWDRSHSIYPVD